MANRAQKISLAAAASFLKTEIDNSINFRTNIFENLFRISFSFADADTVRGSNISKIMAVNGGKGTKMGQAAENAYAGGMTGITIYSIETAAANKKMINARKTGL